MKDEVGGVLVLAGAFGGNCIGLLKLVHSLPCEDRSALRRPLQRNGEIVAPSAAPCR